MMNAGRLDDAEAMFSAIISRKPAFAEAWNKRATVRFFRGDDAGSANDILQVIRHSEPGEIFRFEPMMV